MAERNRRGCLKTGCLGCLAVVGLGLLVSVVLAILTIADRSETRVESVEKTSEIPGYASTLETGTAETLGQLDPGELAVGPAGKISLDVGLLSFRIEPGPPGSGIQVRGRYDAGGFRLEESMNTEGDAWAYGLKFGRKRFSLRSFLWDGDTDNRVTLVVARDLPFALEGSIGIGESDVELGGLRVTDVDLDVGTGDHSISFDEPLPEPMRRFVLDAGIGELGVYGLGNASPEEATVLHSIGEVTVDLGGRWVRDAEIDVRCGIGECGVELPRGVAVDIRRTSVMLGEASSPGASREAEPGQPTLSLSVSGSIGEVRVGR